MGRLQRGYIYEASGFFYVRYCVTEIVDGQAKRVQRSHKLAQVGASVPQENGGGTYHMTSAGKPCKTLKLLRDEFMLKINQGQQSKARRDLQQDMPISEFWEHHYLPYCEEIVQLTGQPRKRRSTVRGYKQIWKQHLKTHFANMTLQEYEPRMGTQFLQSLTGTQGKTTLKHIKAFGSSIFKRAVVDQRLKVNPWHSVQMPDDAIESERTKHYTLEEAEDLVSALVDHADCQLILALSCFLGLRPGEIAALKWEDFDAESVHIRRSVVLGTVGTPKTLESVASLPLIDQVKLPLELWRTKSGKPKQGWVFKSHRNGKPVDLHNVVNRIIIPHVNGGRRCVACDRIPKKSSTKWKGLYAGRRGACTAVVEATGGNYAVAQALLRHKSMKTTLDVYKKQITPDAFKAGMKLLEAAATNGNGK